MQNPEDEVIDRGPIESDYTPNLAKVEMAIQDHKQEVPMIDTKLVCYPIFLKVPCLGLSDTAFQFALNTVSFGSQNWTMHCNEATVMIWRVSDTPPEPIYSSSEVVFQLKQWLQKLFRESIIMLNGSSVHWTVKIVI